VTAIPSTWFSASPHWEWLIIFYFFIGGIAGGSYFLAALIDLFGPWTDRAVARLGYYVALPSVMVSAVLLTADLGRPLRFWHMLLKSETGAPLVKPWSPMSLGSWMLFVFGAFALLGVLGALAEERPERWGRFRRLRPPGVLGTVIAVIGGACGFFVAGYIGVLLAVTNRPIWADTPVLGLAFLVSAASTSAALLLLLGAGRAAVTSLRRLRRFDVWMMVLELVVVVLLVASLGPARRLWLNHWGLLLLIGVVVLGNVVPLVLHWRPGLLGRRAGHAAAVLVLLGGLMLRIVVVLSAQRV
jgi:protein NrfD